jgi:hypothetical protein
MQVELVFILSVSLFFSFSGSLKKVEPDGEKQFLKDHVLKLKEYAFKNGYNTSVGFLIDMNIANGKKRFFVCDLNTDSVLISGLVAHGNGTKLMYAEKAYFSNKEGSLCSSEGKYKVGNKYAGKFGVAYSLYGLDTTNNNAYTRYVVLHAHSCIPDQEVFPSFICNSAGCPTVSNKFLEKLARYISKSKKPILLWIFK